MSTHERERLAAWLDGELPPAERATVEAHLAECEECAALLANMEAVDGVARQLPVEAPEGYFEAFPGRVRSRIEATGRKPTRWRTPAWTWAAAAALLLGVVTPLTIARLGRDGAPPTPTAGLAARDSLGEAEAPAGGGPREGAVVAPAAAPPASPERPEPTGVPAEERERLEQAARPAQERPESASEVWYRQALREDSEADEALARPRIAEPGAVGRVEPSREGFAAAPGLAAAPEAPAVSARGKAELPAAAEVASDPVAAPAAVEAPRANVPTETPSPSRRRELKDISAAKSVPQEADRRQATAADTRPAEEPRLEEALGGERGHPLKKTEALAGAREGVQGREDAVAFVALRQETPAGAEGWRSHREAWRAFLADHPGSPLLDRARVELVRAGVEAWRAGGDTADREAARADARAYLARDDAGHRDAVRDLLGQLEGE